MSKVKRIFLFIPFTLLFCIETRAQDDEAVVYDTAAYAQQVDSIVAADYKETSEYIVEDTFVVTTLVYDSTFQKKYTSGSFVYTEEKAALEEKDEGLTPHFNLGHILDILFYVVMGAAVIFLIYFLFNLFGTATSFVPRKQVVVKPVEKETPVYVVDETDFVQLIAKAKAEKNYKLAVRYYFLLYLKSLSQKGVVKWNKDKTNYQYKREIKDSVLLNDFSQLANEYEWIWYGEITISEALFLQVERDFIHHLKARS